jgi:hypothetical protein
MVTYSNFYPYESTLDGDTSIAFPLPIKRIQLTNDSGVHALKFRFQPTETYGTILPKESVSIDVTVRTIYLSTDGLVEYRIWGMG